jgi:hypothetical protein
MPPESVPGGTHRETPQKATGAGTPADRCRPNMTNGIREVRATGLQSTEQHRITARTVRTASGVETEYAVDGAVVGSVAEVEALVGGHL